MSSPESVVFDLPADTFKICSPSRAAMMTGPSPALEACSVPPLSAVYSRICLTNGDWPLHLTAGRYPWAAGFYDMNADTDHCTVNSTALPEMLKPLGCERSSTPRRLFRFHPVHALPPLALSPPLSLTTSVALGLAGVRPHARARQVGHWLLREEVLRHVPRIRHVLWLLHRLRGRLLVSRRFRRLPQL